MEYKISDPVAYLFSSSDPELILRNLIQSQIRNVIGSSTVDSILTDGKANIRPHAPMFSRYGIALDMGTTTLAGRLYDRKGNLLASAGTRNPQTVYGADIISRIEHAKVDKTALDF